MTVYVASADNYISNGGELHTIVGVYDSAEKAAAAFVAFAKQMSDEQGSPVQNLTLPTLESRGSFTIDTSTTSNYHLHILEMQVQ